MDPVMIRAERQVSYNDSIGIHIFQLEPTQSGVKPVGVANNLMISEINPGEFHPPLTHLNMTHAQRLMDDLWACGLRPSEGTGSAGALAATQGHLTDLRKVLFHQLGIENEK